MDSDKLKKEMSNVFAMQSRIVGRLGTQLNYEAIERLVDKMVSCSKAGGTVLLMGMGISSAVCKSASYMLRGGGICCIHIEIDSDAAAKAGFIRKDDLVVVVSRKGINQDVYQMAKIAKERGAYIFTITNYPASRLAVWSDDMLLVPLGREEMEGEYLPVASGIAMSSLFNAIGSALKEKNK